MSPLAARVRALITPAGVFAALVPIALILIVWFGRDTIPLLDEWTWISDRRPWTWHVFFEPHNDHLSVVPLAIYKLLMATAGLGDHTAYRIVLAALHGLCALLVFLLVRRRLGGWEAVVAGGVVLFLGSASDDLLWAFQISFLGTVAGGLGAWLALERGDRRGDVLAGLCLAFAIANSSLGLPIAAGIFVELLVRGGLQRRLLVVALPLAAYLPWYLVYGQSKTRYDSLGKAAHWALDIASSAFGGFAGGGLQRGRLILAAFVLVVVFALVRGWRPSPRAAGLATAAVLFWGLTALARQNIQPATTSRYIYLGAVLMVLLFAELVRDVPRPAWAIAGAAVLAMIGAGLNFRELHNAADYLRLVSSAGRAELGALELAGRAAPANYIPRDEFVEDGA